MIIRIALFITLLAIFYFYCTEDNPTNQLRGPNDINRIEIPAELFPDYINHSRTTTNAVGDSTIYRLTALRPGIDANEASDNYSAQNN